MTSTYYLAKFGLEFRHMVHRLIFLAELTKCSGEKLPDMEDVNGAAHGIVRLWSQYK